MQLLIIVAVLTTVAVSDATPREASTPLTGLLQVVGICVTICLGMTLCCLATAHAVRQQNVWEAFWLRFFVCLRRVHGLLWLLASLVIIHACQWSLIVKQNWHLDSIPLLDDLLVFAPIILILCGCWLALHEVDRALAEVSPSSVKPIVTRRRYLLQQARQYLALVFLPTLTLLLAQDVIRLASPVPLNPHSEGLLCLIPLTMLLLFSPWLVRAVWPARPLHPGPDRNDLLQSAAAAGVRLRDILVWTTNRDVVNAAVIGFVAPLRFVLVSDGLMRKLSSVQIQTVFLHELGHVQRQHGLQRVAVLFVPVLALTAMSGLLPAWYASMTSLLETHLHLSPAVQACTLLPLAYIIYIVWALGRVSRVLEHEADLLACRWLEQRGWARSPQQAVEEFSATLHRIATINAHTRHERGWLHPSIQERAEFVAATAGSVDMALEFEKRLRFVRRTIFTLFALAVVALLCSTTLS